MPDHFTTYVNGVQVIAADTTIKDPASWVRPWNSVGVEAVNECEADNSPRNPDRGGCAINYKKMRSHFLLKLVGIAEVFRECAL